MKRIFPLHAVALTIALLSGISGVFAQSQSPKEARDKKIAVLRSKLASVSTAKDSVPILYDIFDLSSKAQLPAIGDELFYTAGRAGNTEAQLDVLRLVTTAYSDKKDFDALQKRALALPASRERDETILFLKMKTLSYTSKFLPEAERQKEIARLIAKNELGESKDKNQRFLDLYTVVEYLRNESQGEMLEKYLNRLVDAATSSDFQLYAIPNIIYSEATNIYSDAGDNDRAVAADRKLLEVIAALERKYAAQGREFRNYDRNKYISYRRMLRNAKALNPGEAQELYRKCLAFTQTDPDVKSDFENFPRIQAYYHMAVGDYANAIPELKKFLASDKPGSAERRQLLSLLIEASAKTGDDKTRLEALEEYNAMLKEYEDLRAAENYNELQIKYDLADLREQHAQLQIEAKDLELKSVRRTMTLELTAFGLVIVVLVAFLFYWSKYQRNTYNMGKVVDQLAAERNRIRRSLYYDYADDSDLDPLAREGNDGLQEFWRDRLRKKNKKGFEMSTFMTESIVNDLLYIAAVSATDRRKYLHDISADRLMRESIEEASKQSGRKHAFDGEYPLDDFRIKADTDSLRALISHILCVAANYAPEGETITLACLGRKDGITSFAFITPEQVFGNPDDPRLFDLFIDTDQILAHKGTGLFICRMISLLVNCDFKTDRQWAGPGTRFILSIPDDSYCQK